MVVDIVLLTYNRFAYVKQCVEALKKHTDIPYRLIVVDNASSENDITDYLQDCYENKMIDMYIRLPENIFLKAWHVGINEVRSDYFMLSDPDIIVPDCNPCWLSQLVAYMDQYPELVRIGLSLNRDNVPKCWNAKHKKMLTFKFGPYFKKDRKLRLGDVITTTQLIRKETFIKMNATGDEVIDLAFWKRLRPYGLSVTTQHLEGIHLGWNESNDYPDYLKWKNGKLADYKEVGLL